MENKEMKILLNLQERVITDLRMVLVYNKLAKTMKEELEEHKITIEHSVILNQINRHIYDIEKFSKQAIEGVREVTDFFKMVELTRQERNVSRLSTKENLVA